MKKAGDVLSAYLEQMGIRDSNNYAGFFTAWKGIIGPEMSAHSRLRDIRKGILVVDVDHPGWMQKIMFSQQNILQRVKREFPNLGIQEIAFKLVDKLESPRAVVQDTELSDTVEDEDSESSSEEPANSNVESTVRDEDFLESMRKLKTAMNNNPKLRKSR